ncbi:heteromeric transposase endonuclease subunit TnsA [Sutcliffiella horikoshii]|uniref:Heteromeric transposase endonuclease subunit TnsA n=1 Tax=Sutcliffiella horikoshii TaxID=79883 RepID=A0A5D4S811_9BACI|nr:TnsA endonuclease N-terminal domain-containing protein [Sutcliffiella horikoshii]TYS59360.1 heteromeric transposase endonuclease subunit TnsA [Sutcliffiella horikoshii]
MAKRSRKTSAKTIERRIKEGRGRGCFSDYKPWLTIYDVPSHGVVTRIRGWKTRRLHHLFSENYELAHFYQMEWSQNVIDIREQYPLLPLEKTLFIAEKLGIKHPRDPKTQHPIVMTTDMLLTVKDNDDCRFIAHTIKPISKINKRVIEKFQIEKEYFKDLGIDWALITENEINYDLVKNVEWIHSARYIDDLNDPITYELIVKVQPRLYLELLKGEKPLAKVTLDMDIKLDLPKGTCIQIVRYLIANRYWEVDITKRILPAINPIEIGKTKILKEDGLDEYIC